MPFVILNRKDPGVNKCMQLTPHVLLCYIVKTEVCIVLANCQDYADLKPHFKSFVISITFFTLNKSALLCFMTESFSFSLNYMVKI